MKETIKRRSLQLVAAHQYPISTDPFASSLIINMRGNLSLFLLPSEQTGVVWEKPPLNLAVLVQ